MSYVRKYSNNFQQLYSTWNIIWSNQKISLLSSTPLKYMNKISLHKLTSYHVAFFPSPDFTFHSHFTHQRTARFAPAPPYLVQSRDAFAPRSCYGGWKWRLPDTKQQKSTHCVLEIYISTLRKTKHRNGKSQWFNRKCIFEMDSNCYVSVVMLVFGGVQKCLVGV